MDPANTRHIVIRSLIGPVLAAVVLHSLLLTIYVYRHGKGVSVLVCAGEKRIGRPPYEAITNGIGDEGYDGQFYYAIARDPWKRHTDGIDAPAARHLRILYPAVCWLFSHGLPRLLIWTMPAVNLLAIGGLAGLGSWLAIRHGMSAWSGFTLPLAVSAGLPAFRDLTDPVSTCAVCGLIVAWQLGWPGWVVAGWAVAAMFSREQNVAIALALVGLGLWHGNFRSAAGIALVVIAWFAWVALLRAMYGAWPFLEGSANFGVPFAGLASRGQQSLHLLCEHGRGRFGNAWSTLNLTLGLGLALPMLLNRKASGAVWVILAAGVALAVVAGPAIYEEYWSYTRVLVWLPLGVWLGIIQSQRSWLALLLVPQMLWSLLVVTRV